MNLIWSPWCYYVLFYGLWSIWPTHMQTHARTHTHTYIGWTKNKKTEKADVLRSPVWKIYYKNLNWRHELLFLPPLHAHISCRNIKQILFYSMVGMLTVGYCVYCIMCKSCQDSTKRKKDYFSTKKCWASDMETEKITKAKQTNIIKCDMYIEHRT